MAAPPDGSPNVAIAPDPDAERDPDYAVAGVEFVPSARQVAYLLAVEDALTLRQPPTDKAISEQIGVDRRTLTRWRQDSAFCAWWTARMDRTSDVHWPMIVRRQELNAIQGSTDAAEFIAKIRKVGAFAPRPLDAGGFGDPAQLHIDASKHYSVNILVHRPDDVASSQTLPLDHPEIVAAEAAR